MMKDESYVQYYVMVMSQRKVLSATTVFPLH